MTAPNGEALLARGVACYTFFESSAMASVHRKLAQSLPCQAPPGRANPDCSDAQSESGRGISVAPQNIFA